LVISDDGRGFDAADAGSASAAPSASEPTADASAGERIRPARGSYGLCSIRERLALLGGGLDVTSGRDGSRLRVRLPLGREPGALDGV
jgi:signal transduction histidine kinase